MPKRMPPARVTVNISSGCALTEVEKTTGWVTKLSNNWMPIKPARIHKVVGTNSLIGMERLLNMDRETSKVPPSSGPI